MGPPRTYAMDSPIGVECHARERFQEWLDGRPDIDDMIDTYARRAWRDSQVICPAMYWQLTRADLNGLAATIARRIDSRAWDGTYRLRDVVYRSDGEKFWAELPM